jgi:4-hydroxybenzoate polyprenyltransferase
MASEMDDKWKSRLFDVLFWAAFALLMIYGLPLWIALPIIILPMVGLLVFWIVHEWVAVRRRRKSHS